MPRKTLITSGIFLLLTQIFSIPESWKDAIVIVVAVAIIIMAMRRVKNNRAESLRNDSDFSSEVLNSEIKTDSESLTDHQG